MSLTQEQMLIERYVTNETKSIRATYLLCFLTGVLGGHRFYLGKIWSGALMALLFLGSLVSLPIGTSVAILAVVGLWTIIDAFLIPGMVQDHNNAIRKSLGVLATSNGQPVPNLDETKWSHADRERYLHQELHTV